MGNFMGEVTAMQMRPTCNICGSQRFESYRGRPAERCANCGSKARHRVAQDIYERLVFPLASERARILHFAPEEGLHRRLDAVFGTAYTTADLLPERYPHAQALRIALPDGISVFPDGYFDAVLHNHVLEHIPGHYRDHIAGLMRIVKPGGVMIFSVPGPYYDRETEEGGEHLASDAERLARFLQEDHFKLFGADLVRHLEGLASARLEPDGMTDARRVELAVRPGKSPFFILRKAP
jgi:SAM-dependent methyltransferase